MWAANDILAVLDKCCEAYTFPMLDNGYVYLAATRLSLHRSPEDWAMVIEVFGFSPRSGVPDIHVYTFGSRLIRDEPAEGTSKKAQQDHLKNNPHNESRFFQPIDEGSWHDEDDPEVVSSEASTLELRGEVVKIPRAKEFKKHKIELEDAPSIQTFELCRFLAATHRDLVLATAEERRASVPSDLTEILVLDEWNHPNVVDEDERPSGSKTFKALADVLVHGDVSRFKVAGKPNTHWSNWPDGGTL